ncbi:hypothetical protein QL093DRAFT_2127075, partial [Fusarium oxysporum]
MWLYSAPWLIFGPPWVFSLYISCGIKHIGKSGVLRCFFAIYYLQAIFGRNARQI